MDVPSEIQFDSIDSTTRSWLIAPLKELSFSERAHDLFESLGLKTVSDLIACSEADLLRTQNCGHGIMREINLFLVARRLKLNTRIKKPNSQAAFNLDSKTNTLSPTRHRVLDVQSARRRLRPIKDRPRPTGRTLDFCGLDEKAKVALLSHRDELGLSVRTRNICVQQGLKLAGEIVQIPEAEWYRFWNCGRKTVGELKSWAASHGLALGTTIENWPLEGEPPPQQKAKSKKHMLPSPREGELSVLLAQQKADSKKDSPPSVIDFESADLAARAWLIAPLSELDFSVRAQNVFLNLGLRTVGDLVACTEADFRHARNCGRRTLREINLFLAPRQLRLGTAVENCNSKASYRDERVAIEIEKQKKFGPLLAAATVVEEELISLVALETDDRNVRLLTKLWGWFGNQPTTLEAVGTQINVTRERVRQVAANVSKRISRRNLAAPLVLAAARLIRRSCPATADQLMMQLRSAGLSRVGVHPRGIAIACEMLGIPLELQRVSFGKIIVYSLEELSLPFREFEREARRRTQSSGCVNFEAVGDELGIDDSIRAKFRALITETKEFAWLNEEKTWFYSRRVPRNRNRLLNLASKVLSVCPKIRASELRGAMGRSRRLDVRPPATVLERLVLTSDLATSEAGFLVANARTVQPPEPGSTDDIFVEVLRQHGPALTGPEFEEHCIQAGVNPITFYIYRSRSPVVSQLAPGVYSLVGAIVPPGLVDELASKSRRSRLVKHGWDDKGQLWCGLSLSRAVITAGSIALPAVVANLVQGEWTVALPDSTRPGQAGAKETFLYPIRKALAYLGAEPGDFVLLEFSLQTRVVNMRVGGHELIEAAETGDLDRLIDD